MLSLQQVKYVFHCQERLENLQHMEKQKEQIEELLSSDVRLLNDLQATKKLIELKKQYDETQER